MGVCSSNSGEFQHVEVGSCFPEIPPNASVTCFFLTSFPKSQDAESLLHSTTAMPQPGVTQPPQLQWPRRWEL